MLAWKALISELESRNRGEGGGDIDNDSANYGSVRHLEFTKDLQPKVEVRPRDNSGLVQFHPIWARSEGYILTSPLEKNTLLMGYVKDQNGDLLDAGSMEALIFFKDEDGNDMQLLRFTVASETRDVTVCALYGNSSGGVEDDLFIFHKTQRLPPNIRNNKSS